MKPESKHAGIPQSGDSFVEYYQNRSGLILGKRKALFSEKSPFQTVEVFESDSWGNVMAIDGIVMLSEQDEFAYHEMLVHVPLFSHPAPKRVLIIGGGDGGSAREAMRHAEVETVDMVEIDEAVIRAARTFLPGVGDFKNPKLNLIVGDGLAFVKSVSVPYDVIIIDGSDPVGPAEGLFNRSFYEDCKRALAPSGIITAQCDSPWLERFPKTSGALFSMHASLFAVSKPYLSFVPLYPTGMFTMAYASESVNPVAPETLERVKTRIAAFKHPLRYYNVQVHQACFALPNFVDAQLTQK